MSKTPKLTDADVTNLIDCAGSGIAYWASYGHLDTTKKTYRVVESDAELAEGDAPADKTLTFDDIRTAFVALAKAGTLPSWQMREIEENDLGFDATVGDLVVQWAMFGEIVFG